MLGGLSVVTPRALNAGPLASERRSYAQSAQSPIVGPIQADSDIDRLMPFPLTFPFLLELLIRPITGDSRLSRLYSEILAQDQAEWNMYDNLPNRE